MTLPSLLSNFLFTHHSLFYHPSYILYIIIIEKRGVEMHYDTIIIGAGSMGMPAGYFSAKDGHKTLLIDQFNPPHDWGSHHGNTRIIRYAYGEGENYVPLALRAKELWLEAEKRTSVKLLHEVGVLNIGIENSTFMNNIKLSAKNHQLDVENLSTTEIENRWNNLTLPFKEIGCYEKSAGYLQVEECIKAYKESAEKAGAHFAFNTKVTDIISTSDGITILTNKGQYTANKIIITVGAWAKKLLKANGLNMPVSATRKTFAWFEADKSFDEANFPCFSFELGHSIYYGFPSSNGSGLKIGRHDGGQVIDPDLPSIPFGEKEEDLSDLLSFLTTYMPSISTLKFGKTCMYEMTPDEDFIIDYYPGNENIILAAGFSGHGFKFASAVGELLCRLAYKETIDYDIKPFSLNRFI